MGGVFKIRSSFVQVSQTYTNQLTLLYEECLHLIEIEQDPFIKLQLENLKLKIKEECRRNEVEQNSLLAEPVYSLHVVG